MLNLLRGLLAKPSPSNLTNPTNINNRAGTMPGDKACFIALKHTVKGEWNWVEAMLFNREEEVKVEFDGNIPPEVEIARLEKLLAQNKAAYLKDVRTVKAWCRKTDQRDLIVPVIRAATFQIVARMHNRFEEVFRSSWQFELNWLFNKQEYGHLMGDHDSDDDLGSDNEEGKILIGYWAPTWKNDPELSKVQHACTGKDVSSEKEEEEVKKVFENIFGKFIEGNFRENPDWDDDQYDAQCSIWGGQV